MFSTIIFVFGALMQRKVSDYQYDLGVNVQGQIYLNSDQSLVL